MGFFGYGKVDAAEALGPQSVGIHRLHSFNLGNWGPFTAPGQAVVHINTNFAQILILT